MLRPKWFRETPDFTDDAGMMRTAHVLNRTLLLFAVLMGVGFIAALLFFEPKMGGLLAILVMLAATAAAKLLMRIGKIRLASIVAVTVGWMTFACIVLVDGGLNSINACFFISMTIVAGLLLGTRAATFFAGAGITAGLVLALLDHFRSLPYQYFVDTPLGDWTILVFALILASSTLNLALRERDNALGIAERQLSDLREAEEALRQSEERYRLIAESSAELITVTDMNLQFTYISPSIMRTHGYTVEEAMNKPLEAYMTPGSMQALLEAFGDELKLEAGGGADPRRSRVLEVEEYRKDGSVISLECSFSALRDEENRMVGIVTVSRDITARKKAEEALRESEMKYIQLFMNAPAAIYEADYRNRRFLGFNEVVSTLTGYSREELLKMNPFELFTEWSRETYIDRMKRLGEGRDVPTSQEYELRKKDGGILWMNMSIDYGFEDGLPVKARVVAHDITDRKRMEKALQESEELYRTSMESSSDGIAIVHEGRYVYVNQPFLDKIGRRRDEILGKTRGKFIHPDDQAAFMDYVHKITHGLPAPKQVEIRVLLPDGTLINAEVSMVRVTYKGNRCNLAFLRDITDRKRVEAERLKAQKLESVGTLAAGIAHDFNNLLAVMQGYMELLKTDIPEGSRARTRLLSAEKAVSQATDLTNRLLVFSKGGEPVREIVNIGDLVRETVLANIGESPVETRFHLDRDLRPVEVDERQIRQVIRNLTLNAVEAMPDGGTLTVGTENATVRIEDGLPVGEGDYVRISLSDTGKGIPADQRPLIFDPYFSTKARGAEKGMGLGLSVCHSVVGNHKGCIAVESREGEGSTFHVYLPAAAPERHPACERVASESADDRERILVMDDEAMVRDMLKELLTSIGYEVETTGDGRAAIDLYRKAAESRRPYGMVILDLVVPGGLGGEPTMERLRAIDPGVRGIILSGYSDDPVIQNYKEHGFVEALTKPFPLKALREILEKHLQAPAG